MLQTARRGSPQSLGRWFQARRPASNVPPVAPAPNALASMVGRCSTAAVAMVHNARTRVIRHAELRDLVRRKVPRDHVLCCGNQIREKLGGGKVTRGK